MEAIIIVAHGSKMKKVQMINCYWQKNKKQN